MADHDTHENLSRGPHIEGGSDRSFGLIVGGILVAIGAARSFFTGPTLLDYGLFAVGGALVGLGLAAPALLAPLNRAWTGLGVLLAKVVNPIVLGLIFVVAFLPVGLAMRLAGRDLLRLRRDSDAASYWIVRAPPGPPPESLKDQF